MRIIGGEERRDEDTRRGRYTQPVDNRSLFLIDRLIDAFEFAALGRSIVAEEEKAAQLSGEKDKLIEAHGDYRMARDRFGRVLVALMDHLGGRSVDLPIMNKEDIP